MLSWLKGFVNDIRNPPPPEPPDYEYSISSLSDPRWDARGRARSLNALLAVRRFKEIELGDPPADLRMAYGMKEVSYNPKIGTLRVEYGD